jgi:lipopolysaccharide exporter
MAESLKQKAFSNMQWTGLSSVYVSVVQLIQLTALAFFLEPAEIGTMTMLLLMIWFSQLIADGGMSPAIIHHTHIEKGLLNVLFILNIAYSTVLYAAVFLLKDVIASALSLPGLSEYIPVAGSVIIIAALGTQFRIFLNKELRFDLVAIHETSSVTLNSILAVFLAYNGFGVWAMVIGYLSGTILSTILLIWYGSTFWKPGFTFSVTGLWEFARFGIYQMGERISLFLNLRLDQLLIASLVGAQALGIYTIAHNFVVSPTIRVNQTISSVMFPVFARMQDEIEALRKGYLKLVKVVTIINTPVLLGIALTSPLFIPMFFKEQWHDSIYIIQILSVYALIRSTGSPAGSLQLALGRADLGFKWNFGMIWVSVPAIYIGAISNGLIGIAWAQIVLHASLFVPYWLMMIRPLIGRPARDYYFSVFDAMVPGIFTATGVWFAGLLTYAVHPALKLAVMILTGIFLYGLFVYKTERTLFNEVFGLFKNKYFGKHAG